MAIAQNNMIDICKGVMTAQDSQVYMKLTEADPKQRLSLMALYGQQSKTRDGHELEKWKFIPVYALWDLTNQVL